MCFQCVFFRWFGIRSRIFKIPIILSLFRKNWSPNTECNSSYVIYSDLRQIYSNRPDSKGLKVDFCKPWSSSWLKPTIWSAFGMLRRQPECRFLCCTLRKVLMYMHTSDNKNIYILAASKASERHSRGLALAKRRARAYKYLPATFWSQVCYCKSFPIHLKLHTRNYTLYLGTHFS